MTVNRFLPRDRLASLVDRSAADQGTTPAAMRGPGRQAPLVRARFAVVWVARTGLRASLPQIGRELGGRDHTTMMHACRRAEGLRATDPNFRAITDRLLAAALEGAR